MHAATSQQMDLFSYNATAPVIVQPVATPQPAAPRPTERTIHASRWMGVSVVRAAFTKPNSTIVHLVVGEACYQFGARELRRLLEDVADTHSIQISADRDDDAIHIQIRNEAQRIYSTMLIRDGAWYREPRAKVPAKRQRWIMGDAAYTAAHETAHRDLAKKTTAQTIRVVVYQQD
ncbi:hypothetical protein Haur_5285 (plasmid) [Herpetosiphon aurantiacus DSM 785]|uniref:Uncharacterized protein n=1 Tax=Herpetosiphon aurantiacus (strain ATCC 23779 / DSM 785 / 114-95) TaxID=316274 RepID=A9B998_HERA2|nr:hypothetical protein Haur_5285 [Herpetosiphon aurantiacus DSM 785]